MSGTLRWQLQINDGTGFTYDFQSGRRAENGGADAQGSREEADRVGADAEAETLRDHSQQLRDVSRQFHRLRCWMISGVRALFRQEAVEEVAYDVVQSLVRRWR